MARPVRTRRPLPAVWELALQAALLLLLTGAAAGVGAEDCPLEPPAGVTNSLRTPGDGGYSLQISGEPDKYVPGSVYTISVVAPPGRTFRRFLVTVEPAEAEEEDAHAHAHVSRARRPVQRHSQRRWAGSFQLFGDSAAQFSPNCINAISEGGGDATTGPGVGAGARNHGDLEQYDVQMMWQAPGPQPGASCVLFRAMVFDNEQSWYADEGGLRRTLCELVVHRNTISTAQAERQQSQESYDECCACDDAKYKFVFQGIWSNVTHPKDFPFSLWLTHFSDVIGASHEANFSFWGEGQIATDGFRQLAEWGSVGWLERELRTKSKHLRSLVKASGLWYPRVNQNTSASFNVDRRRHLVSLASMFGPSPDWVVGVSGLDLCLPDCSWAEEKTIDLYPIDAGTDSGITYMSPNAPTVPREVMYRITTMYPEDPRAPFYDPSDAPMQPLARLYITRESVTKKVCREDEYDDNESGPAEEAAFEDTENTDEGERPECRVDEWQPWSPCSVSCGKGIRMRQRNYQMAAKADMLGCDRQLVQKEMCVAHEPSCPGDPVELSPNEVSQLPVDTEVEGTGSACEVTEWGPWSECSSSCGDGFDVRSRRFLDRMGLKKCPFVELTERRKCSRPPCVGAEVVDPNCRITEWSDWSPCSVSCGTGRKFRSRLVLVIDEELRERCARYHTLSEERPCSIKESCITNPSEAEDACLQEVESGPCRAYFERWYFDRDARDCRPFGYGGCRGNKNNFHSLGQCSLVCAGVREKLVRGLPLPARILPAGAGPAAPAAAAAVSSHSAAPIPFPATRARAQAQAVPPSGPRVDCVLSEWGEWSACSASCGFGYRERSRRVLVEPLRGGQPCPNRLRGRKRCHAGPCDPFQATQETEGN